MRFLLKLYVEIFGAAFCPLAFLTFLLIITQNIQKIHISEKSGKKRGGSFLQEHPLCIFINIQLSRRKSHFYIYLTP